MARSLAHILCTRYARHDYGSEVKEIALQVIDSDESDTPPGDGKHGTYQGRHRGADRLRQLASAGGVLAVITALLAGGGTILFWVTGLDDTEALVDADGIGDPCAMVVDEELLEPWADAEQAREPSEQAEAEVRSFDCTYSAEHTGDAYRLVTIFASVKVYESIADARAAHAGVLDFEDSEGHETSSMGGVADQASVAVVEDGEETELRVHAQEANVTASLNLFLTGSPPEGSGKEQLAKDLASGLVDALPREGN